MLGRLFLLFTVIPIIEIYLLVQIHDATGWNVTLALVFGTGMVGAALARWQGFQTLQRIQSEMAQGRPPADAMLHGLMILLAGAFLITPGVMTDVFGFSLLFPPFRSLLGRSLKKRLASKFTFTQVPPNWPGPGSVPGSGFPPSGRDEIIETKLIDTDSEEKNHE